MVSQEIQQKGYLLGLVLNGMNKTLEITLQEIILHWRGNGQDNLIALFISNPQKLQKKLSWTTLFVLLSLWHSSIVKLFYRTKEYLLCYMKLGSVHKELKRTVNKIFWEEQVFTILRVWVCYSISIGMTVVAEGLYFPSLLISKDTREGYRNLCYFGAAVLIAVQCSVGLRESADKENVGNFHLWVWFLFFKGACPLGNSLMTAGQRGDIRVNICHCPLG